MKSKSSFIDLTQRPPRSFRVRLGNYVILARMLEKSRATVGGKNGEYKYNSTLFAEYLGQLSKTREDVKTWFEAIELDDYASFGGKA